MVARLDGDQKGVARTDTPGGTQSLTVISESGFYDVVLRSDKPQGKPLLIPEWVYAYTRDAESPSGGRPADTRGYALPRSPVAAALGLTPRNYFSAGGCAG